VDKQAIQSLLVETFYQWGLPENIRVDNGSPFGSPLGNTIPPLALWLIGLRITMIWNRPGIAQENAKVERMQGTTARWTEFKKSNNLAHLQVKLLDACLIQREKYKVSRLRTRTRAESFPALFQNTRVYQPQVFQAKYVYEFLEKVTLVRKINQRNGSFTFFDHFVYLGKAFTALQVAILRFNPGEFRWDIFNQNNELIATLSADYLTADRIQNLSVCQTTYLKCQILMS
jgi:hypothetical protein